MTDTTTEESKPKKPLPKLQRLLWFSLTELLPARLAILPIRPRPCFRAFPVPLEVGMEQTPSISACY